MRKLVLVVSGIGVVGVIGGATLGPFVGHILFGAKFKLGNLDLALLAAGSGMFILALTLSQGLIALDALATGAGVVAGRRGRVHRGDAGVVDRPVPPGRDRLDRRRRVRPRSTMGLMFVRQLRKGIDRTSLASLVEQIEHEPLEI